MAWLAIGLNGVMICVFLGIFFYLVHYVHPQMPQSMRVELEKYNNTTTILHNKNRPKNTRIITPFIPTAN